MKHQVYVVDSYVGSTMFMKNKRGLAVVSRLDNGTRVVDMGKRGEWQMQVRLEAQPKITGWIAVESLKEVKES